MPRSNERCCCFRLPTAAALVGMMQLLVVTLVISQSATIYARHMRWTEGDNQLGVYRDLIDKDQQISKTLMTETYTNASQHALAFVDIALTDTIAIHIVWLVCLAMYAVAFKTYRAVFVIPNIFMQVIALLWGTIVMAMLGIGLTENYKRAEHADMEEDMRTKEESMQREFYYAAFLLFMGLCWIVEVGFLFTMVRFHSYLRGMGDTVCPDNMESAKPPQPLLQVPTEQPMVAYQNNDGQSRLPVATGLPPLNRNPPGL